ncbi:MAG: PQQ-binding-like beta-propeller repeat protein [Anaerolineaceae bacterium]|nr:PQQ-binding-like beta-propeller repeat protein [Anaerolineaceae bacterium]
MIKTNKMKYYLLLVVIIFIGVSCIIYGNVSSGSIPFYVLEPNDEFQAVWEIFEDNTNRIVGTVGKFIIHGHVDGTSIYQLTALDSINGNSIWVRSNTIGEDVITNRDVLYQGTSGIAYVRAFDVNTGDELWSTRLPKAHSVDMLSYTNNEILVHTTDSQCFVLNDDGEILNRFEETFVVFLKTNGFLYMENGFGIQSVDYSSKEIIWDLEVSPYFSVPFYSDGTLFMNTHSDNGYILAVNHKTGEVNWKVNQDVLSNLYVTDTKLYFVNKDSELVVLDKTTGDEISITKFTPTFDLDIQNEEYYITGDPTNNILAISFGDNNQIIGLKILNP